MKKLLFPLLLCTALSAAKAQKLELSVNAGAGLYNYTGSGANTSSNLIGAQTNEGDNYINNPYGRLATFSYQAGLQVKWVTTGGFLFGAQAGYQLLRSKTNINLVNRTDIYYTFYTSPVNNFYAGQQAKGSAVLTYQYINLNPYLGYRFRLGQFSLDAMPGASFGIATTAREKGEAVTTFDNITFTDNLKMDKPLNDLRATLNVALNLNRWGITAGYAKGLLKYNRNIAYDVSPSVQPNTGYTNSSNSSTYSKVYSQLFSAGLFYRLK